MAVCLTPKHARLLSAADSVLHSIFTPESKQSWVFGLPKSGTTIFAKALSTATGESVLLDTPLLWGSATSPLSTSQFRELRKKHPITFRTRLVKEPNATIYPESVMDAVPKTNHLLLVRTPAQNIRSHLDRLNIPGDTQSIKGLKIPENYAKFFERNAQLPPAIALAHRWRNVHNKMVWMRQEVGVFWYGDFVGNPNDTIQKAASHLNLSVAKNVDSVLKRQLQPMGKNREVSPSAFFGEAILNEIQSITDETCQKMRAAAE